jgi:riboflavin kinase/FMN adenylyltransferase
MLANVNRSVPAIVTIGNFDGVHRGHQHLLRQVATRARTLGFQACAVTFDPHPRQVLRPEQPMVQLTSTEAKVRLMRLAGMQDVWVCSFTPEIAGLEPGDFLRLISARWPIAELWVGAGFALGRGRSGSLDVLQRIGFERGFKVQAVQPLVLDGQVVSSSRIRTLLEQHDFEGARKLLGRNPSPILAR